MDLSGLSPASNPLFRHKKISCGVICEFCGRSGAARRLTLAGVGAGEVFGREGRVELCRGARQAISRPSRPPTLMARSIRRLRAARDGAAAGDSRRTPRTWPEWIPARPRPPPSPATPRCMQISPVTAPTSGRRGLRAERSCGACGWSKREPDLVGSCCRQCRHRPCRPLAPDGTQAADMITDTDNTAPHWWPSGIITASLYETQTQTVDTITSHFRNFAP